MPAALASLAELAHAAESAPAAELAAPTPGPAPVKEQNLVKLPPRSQQQRVILAPQAKPELEAEAAPAPKPTKKRKTDNITAWLEEGVSILDQLTAKQRGLEEERKELDELRLEVERETAEKQAALDAVTADIESYRKLRKFISTARPNIPLLATEQQA